ncbi:peptidyl-prolyl cis-trans isomerase F, mitochondrial [Canna indica]|uniref:Peptidyl-prolyl cis-trans isomerase F, mitochondrial n=1 Tax=Canna indica TaxID=4628 RepID=A0AAQ3QP26_9LILI|nr:peptidyl-prolyl cis-trans isomerase F, mitochondrial [Canna indica]
MEELRKNKKKLEYYAESSMDVLDKEQVLFEVVSDLVSDRNRRMNLIECSEYAIQTSKANWEEMVAKTRYAMTLQRLNRSKVVAKLQQQSPPPQTLCDAIFSDEIFQRSLAITKRAVFGTDSHHSTHLVSPPSATPHPIDRRRRRVGVATPHDSTRGDSAPLNDSARLSVSGLPTPALGDSERLPPLALGDCEWRLGRLQLPHSPFPRRLWCCCLMTIVDTFGKYFWNEWYRKIMENFSTAIMEKLLLPHLLPKNKKIPEEGSKECSSQLEAETSKQKNPLVFLDILIDRHIRGSLIFELFIDDVPHFAKNFQSLCEGGKGISYKRSYFRSISGFKAEMRIRVINTMNQGFSLG